MTNSPSVPRPRVFAVQESDSYIYVAGVRQRACIVAEAQCRCPEIYQHGELVSWTCAGCGQVWIVVNRKFIRMEDRLGGTS